MHIEYLKHLKQDGKLKKGAGMAIKQYHKNMKAQAKQKGITTKGKGFVDFVKNAAEKIGNFVQQHRTNKTLSKAVDFAQNSQIGKLAQNYVPYVKQGIQIAKNIAEKTGFGAHPHRNL